MRRPLILQFYVPPYISDLEFEKLCYTNISPLLKDIRQKRNSTFTLNVSLSTLNLLERINKTDIISHIKDLYLSEKIELVSSTAFGTNPFYVDTEKFENQVILNEFALGYYFGDLKSFDGEEASVMRDLSGFIPHDNTIDTESMNNLYKMGYVWVGCHLGDTLFNVEMYDRLDVLLSDDAEEFLSMKDYLNTVSVKPEAVVIEKRRNVPHGMITKDFEFVSHLTPKPVPDFPGSATFPFWKFETAPTEEVSNVLKYNLYLSYLTNTDQLFLKGTLPEKLISFYDYIKKHSE